MKRGRNQRRRQGGGNPNRALDSNGPDVRIRGTANQIYDKYIALARDASSAGDRVKAESYLQHAEHYFRVIRAMQPTQQLQSPDGDGDQPSVGEGGGNNNDGERQANDRQSGDRQPGERQSSDRQTGERSSGMRNERKREDPASGRRTSPKNENDGDAGNDAAAEGKVEEAEPEAEEKPKRRRARRPTKAAASADAEAGGDAPEKAAAAAE